MKTESQNRYMLDFLGLRDTYSEKDLADGIGKV